MSPQLTPGVRVFDDVEPHELAPGEYSRWNADGHWHGCCPGGDRALCNLAGHQVVEHEDGTITVSPSIKVSRGDQELWHGFLERGVWRTA